MPKTRELLVDKITIPETRVTSYFDSEVYEEFKRTIAESGVLEPIVVVQVGEGFHLVDGMHRLLEARNTGATRITAVVIPGEEKDVFLTNLFLNVLRGKPRVQEMRAVVELLYTEYQMGVDQIAEKTGLSQRFIDDLLVIGKLPQVVQDAFDAGTLEKGKALALTALTDETSQLYIFEALQGKRLTVVDWVGYIKALTDERGKAAEAPAPAAVTAPVKRPCDVCGEEQDWKWLQTAFLCPNCLAVARLGYKAAVSQLSEPAGLKQNTEGG